MPSLSIYDNVGAKRKQKGVRLTSFHQEKLKHICELFGISEQFFWTLTLDFFYMQMLEVQSGRIDITNAVRHSTLEMLDTLTKLKEHKGLIRPTFYLATHHNNSSKATRS